MLNELLIREAGNDYYNRINCADGFSMSVQCSGMLYCSPREDGLDPEDYREFEIGFPSEEEPLLEEYAENPEDPTGTVYGYVPKSVLLEVLAKHGNPVAILEA